MELEAEAEQGHHLEVVEGANRNGKLIKYLRGIQIQFMNKFHV